MFGKARIKLDLRLWEQARQQAQDLGYASLDDYVTHLLERELSASRQEAIKSRVLEKMKGLGYLQ